MAHHQHHIEFERDGDYVVYVAWTDRGTSEVSRWLIPGTQLED